MAFAEGNAFVVVVVELIPFEIRLEKEEEALAGAEPGDNVDNY